MKLETSRAKTQITWKLLAILIFAASLYIYLVGRFGGGFAETDTYQQSQHILAAERAGSFIDSALPYSNGYGFTAISMFLMTVTGLSVQDLQIYVYPLISLAIIPILFSCYKAFLESDTLALFASFLVYLQGDFLFVTWRGSHERFTWLFALLIVFLLVKSLNQREFGKISKSILFLYTIVFGLTTVNTFFASSFLLSVILCFVGSNLYYFLYTRRLNSEALEGSIKANAIRLLYVTVSTFLFIYIFIFYLYPVAGHAVEVLQTLFEKILLVFGGFEQRFNPYSEILDLIWPNRWVYIYVSMFNWLIILISVLGWLWELPRFFRTSGNPAQASNRVFLWLFYAASAFQVGLGVFADQTQALTGNLQVRLFTPFVLFALPVLVLTVERLSKAIKEEFFARLLRYALLVIVLILTTAALLKASLEPSISNKWLYVNQAEIAAGEWILEHGNANDAVWVGIDERIITGIYFHAQASRNALPVPDNLIVFQRYNQNVPYFLISNAEIRRTILLSAALPNLANDNLIYANNEANFYRRRAVTAFQR